MLQSLLADRFQLRIHHETRELPVYALVIGKNGIKLVPNQPACGRAKNASAGAAKQVDDASAYHFPWAFYAQELSIVTDRPVIDETGLDGGDYCTADGQSPMLAIMKETFGDDGTSGSSIFTAVEDKWGMRLESKKAVVDVLVIESVMRPSEN